VFKNINPYVFYSSFVGGKTGRTDEAKESMVSLFRQDVGSKTYPIVVIILRSDFGQREIDTEKLLDMTIEKLANNP
jgi:D-alanyl-D-alanine carboxypeptidase